MEHPTKLVNLAAAATSAAPTSSKAAEHKVIYSTGLFLPTDNFGGNNVWSIVSFSDDLPIEDTDLDAEFSSSDHSDSASVISGSEFSDDLICDDSTDVESESDDTCSTTSTFSCFSHRSIASASSESAETLASPKSSLRREAAPFVSSIKSSSRDDEFQLPDDLYTHEGLFSSTATPPTASSIPLASSILGQPSGCGFLAKATTPHASPISHCNGSSSPPQLLQVQQHRMLWQQMYLNQVRLQQAACLQQAMYLQQQQQQQQQRQWLAQQEQQRQMSVSAEKPAGNSSRVFLPPRFLPSQSTTGTGVFIPIKAS